MIVHKYTYMKGDKPLVGFLRNWFGILTGFASDFSRYVNKLDRRHDEQCCEGGIELFIHIFKKSVIGELVSCVGDLFSGTW